MKTKTTRKNYKKRKINKNLKKGGKEQPIDEKEMFENFRFSIDEIIEQIEHNLNNLEEKMNKIKSNLKHLGEIIDKLQNDINDMQRKQFETYESYKNLNKKENSNSEREILNDKMEIYGITINKINKDIVEFIKIYNTLFKILEKLVSYQIFFEQKRNLIVGTGFIELREIGASLINEIEEKSLEMSNYIVENEKEINLKI
jgi:flagellar capping protein FliD